MYFCKLIIRQIKMFGSQNKNRDILFAVYNDHRTVFKLIDIAMLIGETNFQKINRQLNYYVKKGKLLNPRKGFYSKISYSLPELACKIYTPSYLSLEYVLQTSGIIFQYGEMLTSVSYLSRSIEIENTNLQYRKVKDEILINTKGVILNQDNINIATPERAFLDMLYLNGAYYFDNVRPLSKDLLLEILPIYNSKTLNQTILKMIENDRFE